MRPASLQLLAEYIGEAAAGRLAQAFGGTSLKVPRRCVGKQWRALLDALGEGAASELIAAFGGEHLYIARNAAQERAALRARVLHRLARGESLREIALTETVAVRYTERALRRLIAAAPELQAARRR